MVSSHTIPVYNPHQILTFLLGGIGREDDDVKVDNVVCRTPARNAQNLELVKSEILDMVDRAVSKFLKEIEVPIPNAFIQHSEFTSQVVQVDRLYHRQLITRLTEIDELEKKWNCKIVFPSTEQASDEVTVTGPEWQVPLCADEFLVCLKSGRCLFRCILTKLGHGAGDQRTCPGSDSFFGQIPRVS